MLPDTFFQAHAPPGNTGNVMDNPSKVQSDYAMSLVVFCPAKNCKLHVWYCTRCPNEKKCSAWHHIHHTDIQFQKSAKGKTLSVEIVDQMLVKNEKENK